MTHVEVFCLFLPSPPAPERADQAARPSRVDQWLHLEHRELSIFTQASPEPDS